MLTMTNQSSVVDINNRIIQTLTNNDIDRSFLDIRSLVFLLT